MIRQIIERLRTDIRTSVANRSRSRCQSIPTRRVLMLTMRDASSSSIGTCLRSSAGNTGSPDVTPYRGGCHLDRSGRAQTLAWLRPDGASNGVRARPQADDLYVRRIGKACSMMALSTGEAGVGK